MNLELSYALTLAALILLGVNAAREGAFWYDLRQLWRDWLEERRERRNRDSRP